MPKSKKDKSVSLTKTKKKGRKEKTALVGRVREYADLYSSVYILSVDNMRNAKLKDVRELWKHSRFVFAKNRVISVALGGTKQSEYKTNFHLISKQLKGDVGLLFTSETREYVLGWFREFRQPDFARSGDVAARTVSIEEGPLTQFPFSMEPQLRLLGMPTKLKKGVINLETSHEICSDGDVLTPEQARLLKLFDITMVDFVITVKAVWDDNKFTILERESSDEDITETVE